MAKINIFGTAPHTSQEQLLSCYAPGWPSGTTWYVHSGDGTNEAYSATGTERGLSPARPFASLAYAIADPAVVASRNTQIVLLPGHAETVSGAAAVNLNKIGIAVIGEGYGRNRPTVTFDTDTGASFDINSASCSVRNVAFINAIDGQTAMVNVKAADFTMEDCQFMLGDGSTQAVLGILTTDAADRMILRRLHMYTGTTAGCTNAIRIVGTDNAILEDLDIFAACDQTGGIISIQTTAAVALLCNRLRLNNITAASTKVIVDAITGSTGWVNNSQFGILSGSAPLTVATMHRLNNHYAAAVNTTASAY